MSRRIAKPQREPLLNRRMLHPNTIRTTSFTHSSSSLSACLASQTMRSPSCASMEVDPRSALFHRNRNDPNPSGVSPHEGLRMVQPAATPDDSIPPFSHVPVMRDDVVALFANVPPGVIIDATVGGAGHSRALLDEVDQVSVLGLDRDDVAVQAALRALASYRHEAPPRAAVLQTNFDQFVDAAASAFPRMPIVGVFFDLGVSSPQLDTSQRGFSYRLDGPLDMRMDQSGALDAAAIVNTTEEFALAQMLHEGGEDRFARRIAAAICAHRPFSTTTELAEVVRNAIPAPARRGVKDPAKRAFQAFRIAVNDELGSLRRALAEAVRVVEPGGRIAALTYHSGEDRIVKEVFDEAVTGGCRCNAKLGCGCGAVPCATHVGRRSLVPTGDEVARNPRARSARLRCIEKLPTKLSHGAEGSSMGSGEGTIS